MSHDESDRRPPAERWLLEARAAHAYLDAAEGLREAGQRAQNVARARDVLAGLDEFLAAPGTDDPLRKRLREMRDWLRERLNHTTEAGRLA